MGYATGQAGDGAPIDEFGRPGVWVQRYFPKADFPSQDSDQSPSLDRRLLEKRKVEAASLFSTISSSVSVDEKGRETHREENGRRSLQSACSPSSPAGDEYQRQNAPIKKRSKEKLVAAKDDIEQPEEEESNDADDESSDTEIRERGDREWRSDRLWDDALHPQRAKRRKLRG